jgi:phage shock protein E
MNSRADITEIDVSKLVRMQMLHVAFLLFDVRSLEEFNEGHVKGAVHLFAEDFAKEIIGMVPKQDTPIVIYDADGLKAGDLVLEVEKLGFLNIVNLEGGYEAYMAAPKI